MNIIGIAPARTQGKILAGALNALRPLLPTALLEQWCREAHHEWRDCVWGPSVTILACAWKQLQATASARQTEDWVATLSPEHAADTRDGSDFCAARKRLPLAVFERALRHVGQQASNTYRSCFHDLPVWLLDGTSLRTPNTPENEQHFGRGRNAARSSRSPILRLVMLICAGSGAVLDVALGPFLTSELALFWQLLARVPAGGLLVMDRGFSSYLVFALVQQRGTHVLARQHATRRGLRLKRFRRGDELHLWHRPAPQWSAFPHLLPTCPEVLEVRVITQIIHRRGYRDWALTIATTLTDPRRYDAGDLVELYLQRWDVELTLRTLKTHYHMAQLTAHTPDIICKEVCATTLAHNCVAALMAQSGELPRLLSPTRARALLLIYTERMASAPTVQLPTLFRALLRLIASAYQLPQERPPQPRAIIQRPSTYPVLMTTRQAWRDACHAA